MSHNESTLDRIARSVVGIEVLWIGFVWHSWWALAGLPLLLTGLVGVCPLYALLHIRTNPPLHA